MFAVDALILVTGVLLLAAVASSSFSSRFGVPALVLFVAAGMLAGSEGIGGIDFENYEWAHGVGTVALAIILFDGGLRTSYASFRRGLAPALGLATVGVALTTVITGAAAAWVLGLPLIEGMLLGAIVGSTDAAAVFSALRGSGLRLRGRVDAALEVESGANDPMAVFLTLGLLEVRLGRMEPGWGLAWFFVLQIVVGAAVGLGMGWAGVQLNRRLRLAATGLYPVLATAVALLAFGVAAELHGSGFLAVYLAGIVGGNERTVQRRGVLFFTDGIAWLAQIVMFVVLGLLSFPSHVLAVAWQGLSIGAVLIVVARPLAVAAVLMPFRFTAREVAFIAWAGLKGAVPIVLALFPLLLGLPSGKLLFNVVFFIVLLSAVTQGWSLPAAARRLGVEEQGDEDPPVALELLAPDGEVAGDVVRYAITSRSAAAGRMLRDLSLPEGAVVAMVVRAGELIPPAGVTEIRPGDHVSVVIRPEVRAAVDAAFADAPADSAIEERSSGGTRG
jgi:cell volume regulation protein A